MQKSMHYSLILGSVSLFACGCMSCFGPVDADDFDTEAEEARQLGMPLQEGCYTIIGECDQGRILFIQTNGIDARLTLLFDATTRKLIGQQDDGVFCGSTSIAALRCRDAIVTESFCANIEVGDRINP